MSNAKETSAEISLSPVYPFNEPGQAVLLYRGLIGGIGSTDVTGRVEFSSTPRPKVVWEIDDETAEIHALRSDLELILRRPERVMLLAAAMRNTSEGWSNGGTYGRANTPLKRIIVHWYNLPNPRTDQPLKASTKELHEWLGRFSMCVEGWRITLDVRPDHPRVWENLHRSNVYVMTHVMELRREDNTDFTAEEAEPVLTALQLGVSFALGRWVAPMLQVGQDAHWNTLWENWRSLHCDPARKVGIGWWSEQEYGPLTSVLSSLIREFSDATKIKPLRLRIMLAIGAINDQGFSEQRIMTAAAGLEHIMWQFHVLERGMDKEEYKRRPAHRLLREVLINSSIPLGIDGDASPTIARFVDEERSRYGRSMDGPEVVTWVRNRLVHPQGAQERIYDTNGLVAEVWRLSRHYLTLLILHSLRYQGSCRDLRKVEGWVGNVDQVPWSI